MAFTDQTTGQRVIREGLMPIKITLSDTCHVGDLIGYDGIYGGGDCWEKADVGNKVPASLIAGEQCRESGNEIVCFKMAYVGYPSTTGAVSGEYVYLANTEGQYTATPDLWLGQCVGEMVSTTEMFIHPNCTPFLSYATTGTGWGGHIRAELDDGRTASDIWGGLRIDVKAISGSTVTEDRYGLFIFLQLQEEETAASGAFIRLQDGSSSDCGVYSWFELISTSSDPPHVLFTLDVPEPTNGAWSDSTSCSNTSTGRIKIDVAGETRYIPITST